MSEPFRSNLDRDRLALEFPVDEKIRTHQSFKNECDVNVIMRQWRKTGIIPNPNMQPPMFGDFSTATDYQESVNHCMAAQASFDQLPAEVRKRMGNDPANFMAFLADPANDEEAIALGLKTPPVKPARTQAEIAEERKAKAASTPPVEPSEPPV